MGLRRALVRWLSRDDEVRDLFARTDEATDGVKPRAHSPGHAVDPMGGKRPSPTPNRPETQIEVAAPGPAEPPESVLPATDAGLVLGSAERRAAPLELPQFYQSAPVASGAAAVDYDPALLREAWELVAERSEKLVTDFYAELFLRMHEAPRMFPSSMVRQRQEFGRTLVQWVVSDDPDAMAGHLELLGADHRKFDVEPRHYDVAGAALVSAWKRLAGPAFTTAHEAAVAGSYTRLATAMIDGAVRHRDEPASWGAQVVEHRRVSPDFAIIRIQPDAPYPYKPGQYLTLDLPALRRQWRQMSIASAPRADNTFDVHVRAVGAAGVSAALVHHTAVGDRLRLGPPRGTDLIIEPGTVPGGLLCVASGTGAAPITAIVESILDWTEPPTQLYAFVGGRTREDVYPVTQLNELVQTRGSWARVHIHAVISDDPGYVGYRGRVETVVPTLQDWARLGVDALVAGPSPMMATTVANLAGAGVPMSKIHFDQYDLTP